MKGGENSASRKGRACWANLLGWLGWFAHQLSVNWIRFKPRSWCLHNPVQDA